MLRRYVSRVLVNLYFHYNYKYYNIFYQRANKIYRKTPFLRCVFNFFYFFPFPPNTIIIVNRICHKFLDRPVDIVIPSHILGVSSWQHLLWHRRGRIPTVRKLQVLHQRHRVFCLHTRYGSGAHP